MIEAAERAGVVLLVGHSHSYDLPIKTMREIVAGGSLGRVRMIHTWNFTDWIYRPRRPDELDISLGGGVTFRQGSHQFDIIRLLGGGLVKTVHATTFDWDGARRSIGAHTVLMQFENGAAATAVYNGYGYFSTMELIEDVTEWGFTEPLAKRAPVRRSARQHGGRVGGEAQARRWRDPGERAAPAAFRVDACELRARRYPAIAGRAVCLFGQRARGDQAGERPQPARSGARRIRRRDFRPRPRHPRRPLGPRQSGNLPCHDRVLEKRQTDRVETSGRSSVIPGRGRSPRTRNQRLR